MYIHTLTLLLVTNTRLQLCCGLSQAFKTAVESRESSHTVITIGILLFDGRESCTASTELVIVMDMFKQFLHEYR